MTDQLSLEPAPHILSRQTDAGIMRDVIIALLFPLIGAVYLFGVRVLVMTLIGIVSAVLFEAGVQKAVGRKITVDDYSAAVTGLLVALSLPTTAPLWSILVGNFFAIAVIKQLPGGIGKNPLNPAVAARVMLKVFFEPQITQWVLPGPDAVSTATPLEYIGHFTRTTAPQLPPLTDLLLGFMGGAVGETSKVLILLGGAYLVWKKVIDPRVPLATLAGTGIIILLYSGFNLPFTGYHLLSGTLIFGAVYMVTDYSSGPLTLHGKIIYAFMIGILTALLRILFQLPGGLGIAILIMNMCSKKIDTLSTPRVMGQTEREIHREMYNR